MRLGSGRRRRRHRPPHRLTVSPAQVYAGKEVPATLCTGSSLSLAAGEHEVRVDNTDVFTATRLTLV